MVQLVWRALYRVTSDSSFKKEEEKEKEKKKKKKKKNGALKLYFFVSSLFSKQLHATKYNKDNMIFGFLEQEYL